jgi:transmembrane sensor
MTAAEQGDALNSQAEHWVVRLASGEIEANELAAFKAWLAADSAHRIAFDRERALWQNLEGAAGAFRAMPQPRRTPFRRVARLATPRRAVAAIAATVALAIFLPDIMLRLQADAITARGEIRTLSLPDGSTAMLDSDAAIDIRYSDGERSVALLRGRAWFDVRHDDARPFRVAALGGVTQDIGTAFEVDRGDGQVTIGVSQGAVRVSANDAGEGPVLHALDRARYGEGGPVQLLPATTADRVAPWRRGIIVFDQVPVDAAIAEVARYRAGFTFILPGASHAKVSGVFRTAAPDEALNTLAAMTGQRITMLPGGILIVRR